MATHLKKHIKNTNNKELILCNNQKEEYYAQVIEPKGDARFIVKLTTNNLEVLAKAAGRIIKGPNKQKIFKNDFVLLQKDLSSNDKYFIIHKYNNEEVKKLKKSNEITNKISNNLLDDSLELERTTTIISIGDEYINNSSYCEINESFIDNI